MQDFSEFVVIDTDDFGQDVESSGGENEVVNLVDGFERVGYASGVTVDPNSNHRLAVKTQLGRIGHRNDLHNASVREFAYPLTDRCFAEPHSFPDFGIRLPAIALEEADDVLRGRIKSRRPGRR